MEVVLDFFKNLFIFFFSLNANAFSTFIYWLSMNWFILLSIFFISIMLFLEMKIKTDEIIDDRRDVY